MPPKPRFTREALGSSARPIFTVFRSMEELLAAHGFRIRELLTPADIQKNTIDAAGAELTAFEHANYCLAARED